MNKPIASGGLITVLISALLALNGCSTASKAGAPPSVTPSSPAPSSPAAASCASPTSLPARLGGRPGVIPNAVTWLGLHRRLLTAADAHRDASIVWLGDSIIYRFTTDGAPVWQAKFAKPSLVLAVPGDTVQNLVWRIEAGELAAVHPATIVILIGDNNLSRISPSDILAAIRNLVAKVHCLQPQAAVLLLGVPPRAFPPQAALRVDDDELDSMLASQAASMHVTYVATAPGFIDASGRVKPGLIRSDNTHPTLAGYQVLASEIEPALRAMGVHF